MKYKIETIAPFRKEAKRLINKYPSLKNELAELGKIISSNPTTGIALGNIAIKSGFQLLQRKKGNQEVQES